MFQLGIDKRQEKSWQRIADALRYAQYQHGYEGVLRFEETRGGMIMFENVGTVDRTLRMVFGVALFFVGWLGPDNAMGYILMGVAVVLLFTGATSSCPIYKALGKSTCEKADPRGH